ncbi:MAG: hypothetical protein ABFD89_29435 [Bryobacteraceae bacterium]
METSRARLEIMIVAAMTAVAITVVWDLVARRRAQRHRTEMRRHVARLEDR